MTAASAPHDPSQERFICTSWYCWIRLPLQQNQQAATKGFWFWSR